MTKITLNNLNQESAFKQAIIDIATGTCVIDDGPAIETRLLAETKDFYHPLLTQAPLNPAKKQTYVYQYDDFDGLVDAAKFIFATLIHVENPLTCEFNIKPSKDFLQLKAQYEIPFSLDSKKEAKEFIGVEQFNSIITRFNDFNFQYHDNNIIEQHITYKDLPPEVNGDLLYQTNQDIAQFCKQADDMAKYEVRYINRYIGFGVYARETIKQGENIACYCGAKIPDNIDCKSYMFSRDHDVLNLRVDAMHYGNIARFINHAPKESDRSEVFVSNVQNNRYGLYGNDFVVYSAKKDIAKGEQLFVNYGDLYFGKSGKELFMKRNGKVINDRNQTIKDSRKQRQQVLNIMSDYGVKQAQWLLIRKPAIILGLGLLVAMFLNQALPDL